MDIKKSRKLSYLLRHDPEGLEMDKSGGILVTDLLKKLNITREELDEIVEQNDKKRFSFNSDKTKLRASQGHTLPVYIDLKIATPPCKLYHGTSVKFVDSIRKNGLLKGDRHHVHLSKDIETAKTVGSRRGKYHIFEINALHMRADNVKIYISENGVYLTDFVDPKYIKDLN